MIYQRNDYVPASMCDGGVKLSLIAVFQLVQDAVTETMGEFHIDGVTAMREYGAMWVFVKNRIQIFHLPRWREKFETRCYISKVTAAKLMIDTEMRSLSGEPLMVSRLELCALDLKEGKIRKTDTVGVRQDMVGGEPLPDISFVRFPRTEAEMLESVTVRSTNLDYCFHTNNIEYVRFILNTYPAKELLEREISGLEIHYGNQTHEGDVVSIGKIPMEEGDLFTLTSGGKTAAECMIYWNQKKEELN